MNSSTDTARRERIDAVLALAAPRLKDDQRAHVEAFARAYFHHLDADDLAARTPEDLLGALLSAWQFGAERQPGTTRLRVISPSLAEHGWASRHTVIEVVNDDMPFLVDTTTMEINRQGLSLQLIVHPVLVVQRDAKGRLQRAARTACRRGRPAGQARIVDACRGRPAGRPAATRRTGRRAGARAGRCARCGAGLAADAGPAARRHHRAGTGAAHGAGGAGGRKSCLPAVAGRRAPDAARLPPPRPGP